MDMTNEGNPVTKLRRNKQERHKIFHDFFFSFCVDCAHLSSISHNVRFPFACVSSCFMFNERNSRFDLIVSFKGMTFDSIEELSAN